jgi:hypothetical protein
MIMNDDVCGGIFEVFPTKRLFYSKKLLGGLSSRTVKVGHCVYPDIKLAAPVGMR